MRAADYAFFDAPFLAFAHRGGATYPPNLHRENSRYAFGQAVALGYRYLETDVHATSDRVLFALHDERLDRVSTTTGAVAAMTAAQLARVRVGGLDPVPTFAELLTAFPRARFNVDAKADAAVDLLADTIGDHEAHDRVCVSSFSPARLHRLRRRLGPKVASAASSRGVAVHRFAPWLTGLLDTPAPALQLPLRRSILGRQTRILTDALIQTAHRAGKQVHIWTVDDSETMEMLVDLGVDGIFTDRVDTLKSVLVGRGLWN